LPLAPQIVDAPSLLAAFEMYERSVPLPPQFGRQFRQPTELAWDAAMADLGVVSGLPDDRTSVFDRRDDPVSRRRWRFAKRREVVAILGAPGATPEEESHVS
jgi:hypothetical protein